MLGTLEVLLGRGCSGKWAVMNLRSRVLTWSWADVCWTVMFCWSWMRTVGVLLRTSDLNWFMLAWDRDSIPSQPGGGAGFDGNGRFWFQTWAPGPRLRLARFLGSKVWVLRASWNVARCGPWELWAWEADTVPANEATLGVHEGSLAENVNRVESR